LSNDTETDIMAKEKQEIKEPSQYNVVAHNNDYTSYDEVILILSQAFEMSRDEALNVAQKVDSEDRGVCGTYSKEIADMKILLVNVVKDSLIKIFPGIQREIAMLKFTVEKS